MTTSSGSFPSPQEWDQWGDKLLLDAAQNLLRGEELPVEPWATLAARYQDWRESGRDSTELSPFSHMLGGIALLNTMPLEEALLKREALTEKQDNGLGQTLAHAVVARRQSLSTDQDHASALYELAEKLYQLVRFTQSKEVLLAGLESVIRAYGQSMREYLDRGALEQALGPASMGIALINTWRMSEWYDWVVEWAERLIFGEYSHRNAVSTGTLMICNNVINTFNSLTKLRPENAGHYHEMTLRYSQVLLDSASQCQDMAGYGSFQVSFEEKGYRGLIFSRMNLLLRAPERLQELAPMIWKSLDDYESFGRRAGDPDLRAEALNLKRRIYSTLLDVNRDWTLQVLGELDVQNAAEAMEGLSERIDEARKHATAQARQLLQSSRSEARNAELQNLLDGIYSRVDNALQQIVAEVGLNLHVCRILTALGGIASRRLLPSWFLFSWLFPHNDREALPQGHQATIFESQNKIAQWRMNQEVLLFLALTELAVIVEQVQLDSDVWPLMLSQLRERNVRLLSRLSPEGKKHDKHIKSPSDDLRSLLTGLSPSSITKTWKEYSATKEKHYESGTP